MNAVCSESFGNAAAVVDRLLFVRHIVIRIKLTGNINKSYKISVFVLLAEILKGFVMQNLLLYSE